MLFFRLILLQIRPISLHSKYVEKPFIIDVSRGIAIMFQFRYLALLVTVALLPACQKRITLYSNAYADIQHLPGGLPENTTIALRHKPNQDIETSNVLQLKEFEQKLTIMLENKGYEIKPIEKADYYLTYTYGMNSETRTEYDQKTTGLYPNILYPIETYTYLPVEYTYYTKFLDLAIYRAKESTKSQTPIWHGKTEQTDLSSDLHGTLDFLILSFNKILGINTPGQKKTSFALNDSEVKKLRNEFIKGPTSKNLKKQRSTSGK